MMRNCMIMIAAAALLCGSCRSGAGSRPGVPAEIVTSENTEADLGTVYEADGLARTVLVVRNVSSDTLVPVAAYTACRCAEASVEVAPVAPGEDLRVSVTYNPAYRNGIFMEEIQVRFLGSGKIMSLVLKGEVVPCVHPVSEDHPYDYGRGLHLSHETLHFGNLAAGESRMIYVRIANDTDKESEVSFGNPQPSVLSFRPAKILGAECRDTLRFRFTMPAGIPAGDTLRLSLPVSVNGHLLSKPLCVKAISPVD